MLSIMEEDQLAELHERENKAGYCLPNYNIQALFSLPKIKDRYDVTEEDAFEHGERVKKMLLEKGLVQATPIGWVTECNVAATHDFDNRFFGQRFNFEFACAGIRNKGFGRLKERMLAE